MSEIIKFTNPAHIASYAAVGGKEEHDGPLGVGLDFYDEKNRFSEKTWEKSEAAMQRIALNLALSKMSENNKKTDAKNEKNEKIDAKMPQVIFAGDLINQCTSSSYGLLDFETPYVGIYGACSTLAEGLTLAASFVSAGYADSAASVTSSHFCSAERQFRYPLEYGGQRPPCAQRTVTAAGAFVVSGQGKVQISDVMLGIPRDGGINDPNNMGAAMAPAALDTIKRYFDESGTDPSDYDAVYTGDLGFEGASMLRELACELSIELRDNYFDCGLEVYDRTARDMHAGGSGCGCSAMVLSCDILPKMERGELKNVLLVGTGALMSPASVQQGESIPGIAHLVHLTLSDSDG